jgi:hypothetical protein
VVSVLNSCLGDEWAVEGWRGTVVHQCLWYWHEKRSVLSVIISWVNEREKGIITHGYVRLHEELCWCIVRCSGVRDVWSVSERESNNDFARAIDITE